MSGAPSCCAPIGIGKYCVNRIAKLVCFRRQEFQLNFRHAPSWHNILDWADNSKLNRISLVRGIIVNLWDLIYLMAIHYGRGKKSGL